MQEGAVMTHKAMSTVGLNNAMSVALTFTAQKLELALTSSNDPSMAFCLDGPQVGEKIKCKTKWH